MTSTVLRIIALFFVMQISLSAQNGEMKLQTTVEGISEYHLSNGLRVLMFPDQSKPQITVNVTYLVGSRHEDYGETGMAHLLEHLVFKGTPNNADISKGLKDHGAFYNGSTWFDRTNYFETLASSDENIEWALQMEADRMVNSFISAEDLKSEMTVVRNEFEMGENNPTRVLMDKVMATSYQWHNYGSTTIGSRADLENVPIDKLQAFYREYYQPDNAVLLVVGKFDEAKTKEWILKYFGSIPRPERALNVTYTREPTQDGERAVTLKRVGDVQALAAMYHVCSGTHPDYAALSVLSEILTDQPSGRLYKALVDTKKTSNVWSWAAALKEPGFIYFGADVLKDTDIEDSQMAFITALNEVSALSPSLEEVERAKTGIQKQFDLSFNDSRRVGVFMSEYVAQGDWRMAFVNRDRIAEVSVEDVARVAKKYFKASNRTLGKFIPDSSPDRTEVPEAPAIEEIVSGYKGKAVVSQGEAFDPSPVNIESRVVRRIESNKSKFAFLPKETRGDAVQARLSFKFGTKESLKNMGTIAGLTAAMLNKGTSSLTRQEIKDQFDKLKSNVRFSGNYGNMDVFIETERKYLPEAISLISKVIKEASFPEEEFEKLKIERLAQIEEQKSDPMALANTEIQRVTNPYPADDVRYNPTIAEQSERLKATTNLDLIEFYKKFYSANNASVTVVGDFQKDEIQALLDQELGQWKNKERYVRLDAELFNVKTEIKSIETPDKANAAFFAGYNFAMRDDHPDYPALMLANYIFGGGGLSSRLADRIRQKDGLSYGVGSYMSANPYVAKTTWGAYAIYAPEKAQALETAFKEELMKVITDGFTEKEVEDAKKGWLQSQQVSRSQDGFLSSTLNSYLEYGRTMMWNKELEEKISKLSADELGKAFNKYIIPEKISYVKAGDFAKTVIKP